MGSEAAKLSEPPPFVPDGDQAVLRSLETGMREGNSAPCGPRSVRQKVATAEAQEPPEPVLGGVSRGTVPCSQVLTRSAATHAASGHGRGGPVSITYRSSVGPPRHHPSIFAEPRAALFGSQRLRAPGRDSDLAESFSSAAGSTGEDPGKW